MIVVQLPGGETIENSAPTRWKARNRRGAFVSGRRRCSLPCKPALGYEHSRSRYSVPTGDRKPFCCTWRGHLPAHVADDEWSPSDQSPARTGDCKIIQSARDSVAASHISSFARRGRPPRAISGCQAGMRSEQLSPFILDESYRILRPESSPCWNRDLRASLPTLAKDARIGHPLWDMHKQIKGDHCRLLWRAFFQII